MFIAGETLNVREEQVTVFGPSVSRLGISGFHPEGVGSAPTWVTKNNRKKETKENFGVYYLGCWSVTDVCKNRLLEVW
jgi:hypothetical protein